jgi:hypothetical protein
VLRAILGVVAAITGLTRTCHSLAGVADPPFGAVPGVHPTSRAIARDAIPALANSTIRARSRIRASHLREPANASSACRSSLVSARPVSHRE